MAAMGGDLCGKQRANLVVLLACCNAVLYNCRANMSIAVTFMFSSQQSADRSQALAAFYYGYPLVQVLAGQWAAQFGGKRVLLFGAFCWSVCTLLVIPFHMLGLIWVCLARALVGLAEGVNYPSQMALMSVWIPLDERSQAWSFLCAGEAVGTVAATLGCTLLAHFAGWQAIFVVSAMLGLLWAFAFSRLAARSPEVSTRIGAEELVHIQAARGEVDATACGGWQGVPWKRFAMSRALHAIIVPHFCFNWGYYLCLSILPDYFQTTFNTKWEQMGIITVLPYIFQFVIENLSGLFADRVLLRRWGWSLVRIRKVCTAVALGGAGIMFLMLRTVPGCSGTSCHGIVLAAVYVTAAVGFGGVSYSGFQINYLDISPQYASQLLALGNTIATVPGVLGPMTLLWFQNDFVKVFTFAGAVEIVGAVWFVTMAEAEDQHFNSPQMNGGAPTTSALLSGRGRRVARQPDACSTRNEQG
mmetsp:Transcript_36972/g.73165  ORF Transcript_36972/g.73165 Transcript_36972/m.73165 type:complete len:472 (-) Transcript_36972:70-1485(-)